jgi:hypothetical protein
MHGSGAPISLRIGAMLAMVALIVGLIFLLRECRSRLVGSGAEKQPPAAGNAKPLPTPEPAQAAPR